MGLMGYSPLGHKELGMTKRAHIHTHIIILLKKKTSLRIDKLFAWATQLEKGPNRNSDSGLSASKPAFFPALPHHLSTCPVLG